MGGYELLVDGRAVVVRESSRARRMRLVVGPGRPPEVVVPVRSRRRTVEEFVHRNHDWLAAKMRVMAERPRALPERPGSVWLAGEPVPLRHEPAGRPGVTPRDGHIEVRGTDLAATLERWYRQEARRRLVEAAEQYAPVLDVQVAAVSVRDQRTHWGSCSRQGRLSFSWRLVLAPPEVLTYVVVHELCHLREFNHSPAFWRLVESVQPRWRDIAGWLRIHGHELHAYQPGGHGGDLG